MTLLAPWAWWLSAIAGVVIALYFLKIRRRRMPVPALEFWLRLAHRTQARSLFQQIKRWLSMLLWVVIVACLMLAVGNPVLSLGRITPRSIVVVLDNCASMQTVEDESSGRTRLDEALDAVRELLAGRPVNDEWLVIESAREPRVLRSWTRRRSRVLESAEQIERFGGSGDLTAAVELADSLLAERDDPLIVIISDGAAGQVESLRRKDERIVHWPVGDTENNVGLTRARARLHRLEAAYHVYLSAVNASDESVDTELLIELDGALLAVEPLTIDAGGQWEKTVEVRAPEGGVLRVSIDRPDALALDDEIFAVLEPIEPATVWLVGEPEQAFYLEQAVLAMEPLVSLESSRSLELADYENLAAAGDEVPDLIVFNNVAPAELPARGEFVFINAWPESIAARSIGALEQPEMMLSEADHPLMQFLNLQSARLLRSRQVELMERATVLARARTGEPLIFLIERPNVRALCLAFSVMESDLPFRTAFPLLLRHAVSVLGRRRVNLIGDQYAIGEPIEPLRPLAQSIESVGVAALGDEGMTETSLPVQERTFLYDRTDRSGVLRFDVGEQSVYAAVNLADESESRIAPAAAAASPQEEIGLTSNVLGGVPWFALAAASLGLICLEWITYHRRWTE